MSDSGADRWLDSLYAEQTAQWRGKGPKPPKTMTAPELMAMKVFPRQPAHEVRVYVIQAGEFVKIGIARDPDTRISAMQTGNPHKMRVVFSLPIEDRHTATEVERFAHGFLAPYRRKGEWFACTPELARSAIARGALPPDHWFVEGS